MEVEKRLLCEKRVREGVELQRGNCLSGKERGKLREQARERERESGGIKEAGQQREGRWTEMMKEVKESLRLQVLAGESGLFYQLDKDLGVKGKSKI